jgi:hypothetical protein
VDFLSYFIEVHSPFSVVKKDFNGPVWQTSVYNISYSSLRQVILTCFPTMKLLHSSSRMPCGKKRSLRGFCGRGLKTSFK